MRIFRLGCFLVLAFWMDNVLAARLLTAYTATWCGPCQQFAHDIAQEPEITQDYDLEIIDVDASPEDVKNKNVTVFPTFIVTDYIDNHEIEVSRKVGYKPAEFREWLKRHRAKRAPQH